MDVSIKAEHLAAELAAAHRVADRRTTIPILGNVLLRAAGDRLYLTASDLNITLATSCPATVRAEGSAAVSLNSLHEYVRLLDPTADASLAVSARNECSVVCGTAKGRFQGDNPYTYPEVKGMPEQADASVPAEALASGIRQTLIAVATDTGTMEAYGSALLLVSGERVRIVATDGNRLAMFRQRLEGDASEGEAKCLIARKALINIEKMLESVAHSDAGKERVKIAIDKNRVFFRAGSRTLSARVTLARFPDYERVLPKDKEETLLIGTADLRRMFKRVSKFAPTDSTAVQFVLEDGKLRLKARDVAAGEGREERSVEHEGSPPSVGFSAKYILQFLDVCDSEQVSVSISDAKSVAELGTRSDIRRLRYIVVPIQA